MEMTILGTDRARCAQLRHEASAAAKHLRQSIPIRQVNDLGLISQYHVLRLPALLIDKTVVAAGFIPSAHEIEAMLLARQED